MFHPPTEGRNKMKKGMKKHSFETKKRGGENRHSRNPMYYARAWRGTICKAYWKKIINLLQKRISIPGKIPSPATSTLFPSPGNNDNLKNSFPCTPPRNVSPEGDWAQGPPFASTLDAPAQVLILRGRAKVFQKVRPDFHEKIISKNTIQRVISAC